MRSYSSIKRLLFIASLSLSYVSVSAKPSWLSSKTTSDSQEHQKSVDTYGFVEGDFKSLSNAAEDVSQAVQPALDDLFLNIRALDSYSKKSDCFRRAAEHIRQKCSADDIDEEERIQAAISMTLCELSTARHHSHPMECTDFVSDRKGRPKAGAAGICVDALARSAQHWSSYAGYMREIPQLCSSFQRWNDIDIAKTLYKNATLEKLALLKFLASHEERDVKMNSRWSGYLQEFHDLLGEFKSSQSTFDSESRGLSNLLFSSAQEIFTDFKEFLSSIQNQNAESLSRTATEIGSLFHAARAQHSTVVEETKEILQIHVMSILQSVHSSIVAREKEIADILATAHGHWNIIHSSMLEFERRFDILANMAKETSLHLEAHGMHAMDMQNRQVETSRAMTDLTEQVRALTNTTNSELRTISESAEMLRETLASSDYVKGVWNNAWSSIIQHLFSFPMVSFVLLPFARIFIWCFHFSFPALRFLLGALSLLLCPISSRKRRAKGSNLIHGKASANSTTSKLSLVDSHELRIAVPPDILDEYYAEKPSLRARVSSTPYRSYTSRIPSRLWDPNSSSNIL